ncbi:MAG TPA: lysylphosphatidylglycerol synthase transmembrane domain-containing protein [Anaerolineae bacterium]|jgi:uncharacterized protein (TIRG00374 family)|nr:lysylphosphatidylglycerol synthase transmembrane domain-containing protein [Anaerolineae bacterium]
MHSTTGLNRSIRILFLAVTIVALLSIATQVDEIQSSLGQVQWGVLPSALLMTAMSYLCMSFSFATVGRLFDIEMRQRDIALVGFVTNVINHVVTSGGVAGYSLRYAMMKRDGVHLRDVVAISIMHFYLTGLDMIITLPISLIYLMSHVRLARGLSIGLTFLTVILVCLAILAAILIFARRWRRIALRTISGIASRIVRREIDPGLDQFEESMSRGLSAMRRTPGLLLVAISLIWFDWLASVLTLTLCLEAFGEHVPFGVVMSAFVIGTMIGLVSLAPGGLGVQEGSMSGILALFGVPFGKAILAAVLFRAVFYFLPYMVSLLFSRSMMRDGSQSRVSAAD